jgi:8-oxo-dGTP pyrophosphatase MutT (NUDIX family)
MHRQKLIRDIENYREKYPLEISVINRLLGFIISTSSCFNRSQADGHITGSAWLVNNDHQVLLTYHKKLQMWLQLGGHADGNASVKDVALREAKEESGISDLKIVLDSVFDIDIHNIPASAKEARHYHYDVRYLISAGDTHHFQISDESIAMAWININDIESYTKETSILKMKEKYLQYQKAVFLKKAVSNND